MKRSIIFLLVSFSYLTKAQTNNDSKYKEQLFREKYSSKTTVTKSQKKVLKSAEEDKPIIQPVKSSFSDVQAEEKQIAAERKKQKMKQLIDGHPAIFEKYTKEEWEALPVEEQYKLDRYYNRSFYFTDKGDHSITIKDINVEQYEHLRKENEEQEVQLQNGAKIKLLSKQQLKELYIK